MKQYIINGRYLTQRVTGVQRYGREMLQALDRYAQPGELTLAMPPGVKSVPALSRIRAQQIGVPSNWIWEHISLPFYAARKKAEILSFCNTAPLLSPGISTIHDLKIKVHPEYYTRIFRLWYNLLFANEMRRSVLLLTGTEFSRKEILRYYKVSPKKIVLVPEGWQHIAEIKPDKKALETYKLEKGKYYFSISSRDPNKNFAWIADLAGQQPERVFVIAGGINRKVFGGEAEQTYPDNMKILGYVSDGEAKTLMRDCGAFLFPSFYEGFGLPPLEALSAGCQSIVVSDIPVMHEIFEDQAVYVDPLHAKPFEIKIAEDPNRILKKYSWDASAKKLLHILREL